MREGNYIAWIGEMKEDSRTFIGFFKSKNQVNNFNISKNM